MSKHEEEYDSSNKTMRVYRAFGSARTLVPNDELKTWIDALKQGKTRSGEDLKGVEYVFEDEETATYNAQPLAFAGIKTFLGDRKKRKPFEPDGGTPSFETREDFGIE
jgi:hypothetical protein